MRSAGRALITEAWTESLHLRRSTLISAAKAMSRSTHWSAAVHTRLPGFRFKLAGPADRYGENIRFSWSLGAEAKARPLIKGTDFATFSTAKG